MRRDDPDVYEVTGPPPLPAPARDVIAVLAPVVTPERLARIDAVIARRTRSVIPVLEDVTDPHNASAVLRSADAFGAQEIHVVPGPNGFRAAHAVSKGTHRWLDVVRHADARSCADHLHARGYTIAIAAMNGAFAPEDLRARGPVAIVFGNEHSGVSGAMADFADATLTVPMVGFVESLNVSVAAAITLYVTTRGRQGDLPENEREELRARYLLSTVRDSTRLVLERLRGVTRP